MPKNKRDMSAMFSTPARPVHEPVEENQETRKEETQKSRKVKIGYEVDPETVVLLEKIHSHLIQTGNRKSRGKLLDEAVALLAKENGLDK